MGILISDKCFNNRSAQTYYDNDGKCTRVVCEESVYISEETPCNEDEVFVDIGFNLHKARESEQLVSGWANVAVNADGSIPLDWQDDVISPLMLEKAAINFMLEYGESGVMHDGGSVGTVVESIVFTKEKQEAIGIPDGTVPLGWFITVKVHDADVFAKVKDGTYKMFSIQGKCKRVKV
jgi:hypothetical protein